MVDGILLLKKNAMHKYEIGTLNSLCVGRDLIVFYETKTIFDSINHAYKININLSIHNI